MARDFIYLRDFTVVRLSYTPGKDEGAIYVERTWIDRATESDREDARLKAGQRAHDPRMRWVFVVEPDQPPDE